MIIVVAKHLKDDQSHYIGPFHDEWAARAWIGKQSANDTAYAWQYHIDRLLDPDEID